MTEDELNAYLVKYGGYIVPLVNEIHRLQHAVDDLGGEWVPATKTAEYLRKISEGRVKT
jgi:hypothetical protein